MVAEVLEILVDVVAILTGQPHGRRIEQQGRARQSRSTTQNRARHGRARIK